MIFYDRYREENGQTIQPSDEWFEDAQTKTDDAIEDGDTHVVSDHYKHAQVKMALEKLFYDKCVYCETKPTAGSSWDVEHFRPKGRVAEREDHPGYYWLAYDWENLYLSCTLCNQSRKDQPRWGDPIELPTAGKLDQFPLDVEENRAMTPDSDLEAELPYLLDPNVDNPELYLDFDIQGNIYAIDDDVFGSETIRICNLNRRRLRDDRVNALINAGQAYRLLQRIREDGNVDYEPLAQSIFDSYINDDAPYAGTARAVERNPEAFIIEE